MARPVVRLGWVLAAMLAAGLGSAGAREVSGRLGGLVAAAVPDGLGVNVHFLDGHAEELGRIHALGIRIVRTDLQWGAVERVRGVYDWQRYDGLVADLRATGLTPLLILDYGNAAYAPGPAWPNRPSAPHGALVAGAARAGFLRFVRAAAARYGPGVIWEVWNEPNLNFGRPLDMAGYAGLAVAACRAVRAAVPGAAVIGPASSQFDWGLLRRFLAADRGGCFDAVSVHPYRVGPPESVLADWARLRRRAGRRALVSSEWGYSATAVPAEVQADYAVRTYLLDLLAGVPVSIWYDWRDDGTDPREKEHHFGLADPAGGMKPAGAALGGLVAQLQGLTLLGRVGGDGFVLAFGEGGVVRKLVGWTGGPPREAVVPGGGRMRLSGRPVVVSVR